MSSELAELRRKLSTGDSGVTGLPFPRPRWESAEWLAQASSERPWAGRGVGRGWEGPARPAAPVVLVLVLRVGRRVGAGPRIDLLLPRPLTPALRVALQHVHLVDEGPAGLCGPGQTVR